MELRYRDFQYFFQAFLFERPLVLWCDITVRVKYPSLSAFGCRSKDLAESQKLRKKKFWTQLVFYSQKKLKLASMFIPMYRLTQL